jgi:D-proline reductase (dithiol) PrdB
VLARVFEEHGLSTVLVTNGPFFGGIGVPRTVAVEFPYGHMLGYPEDRAMQMQVIEAALEMLEEAKEPGATRELDIEWPQEFDVARKDWHPSEASPIVRMMLDQAKKAAEERDRAQRN